MLFTGIYVAIVYSVWHNDLPPGVTLTALSILPLDFILMIPISILLAQETKRKLSYWTLSLCLLRWSGAIAFQTWFWFRGLDKVNQLQCMVPRVFWYGNTEASGGVRTWIKGGTTSGAVCVLIFLLGWIGIGLYCAFIRDDTETFAERWYLKSDPYLSTSPEEAGDERERTLLGIPRRWRALLFSLLVLFVAFVIASMAVGLELEIKWNHLDGLGGIDTTGQIIPLVIGSLSLFSAMGFLVSRCFATLSQE